MIKMLTKTSERVLEIIKLHLVEQNEKGIVKYGKNIDEAIDGNYDWNTMVIEELVDGIQYVVKENVRLKGIIENNVHDGVVGFADIVDKNVRGFKDVDKLKFYRSMLVDYIDVVVGCKIKEMDMEKRMEGLRNE